MHFYRQSGRRILGYERNCAVVNGCSSSSASGCAIVQVVSRWPFTAEVRVPSYACPRGIYYGQNATGVGLSASAFVFHVSVILPTLRSHSFVYHRWYIILASGSVVKYHVKGEGKGRFLELFQH